MDDSRWYSPEGFKYTPGQIRWLLGWLPYLRMMGDDWPPKEGTEAICFISSKGNRFVDGSAVTRARAVRGHLENLLYAKPQEGIMIKLSCSLGESDWSIGRYFNMSPELVKKIIYNRLKQIYMQIYRGLHK